MTPVMKTLLLNPPSFKNFDGGASSRWPATREIASYWYPVWLSYPAGMLPGSRLLDAPPHGVTPEQTVEIARDYDFVVLFTSTVGFSNDVVLARAMKQVGDLGLLRRTKGLAAVVRQYSACCPDAPRRRGVLLRPHGKPSPGSKARRADLQAALG